MASTRIMIEDATARLESKLEPGQTLESAGIRVPGESYVNYQFAPKNRQSRLALQYTGMIGM